MKKVSASVLMSMLVLIATGVSPLCAQSQADQVFQGYLCTAACGTAGHDTSGNDLTTNPEKHTVACMKECAYTGMGIMMRLGGAEKYAFYRFDPSGQDRAKGILFSTVKDAAITIEVTGSLASGILTVRAIREIDSIAGAR